MFLDGECVVVGVKSSMALRGMTLGRPFWMGCGLWESCLVLRFFLSSTIFSV
jgi:hypothetical protein